MDIGIDLISFYTPGYYLSLSELARQQKIDPDRYRVGIGQDKMSIAPPDEDTVTLGANAAKYVIDSITDGDRQQIKALIVATETGVDNSKAAGLFIHSLLGLSEECRVIEMKQACYSTTFAIRSAMGMIAMSADQKVLIISSDIAKYRLNSPGEATQGSGAVAMLMSANPRLICFDTEPAFTAQDIADFWRPTYSSTAVVDGQYSTKIYLKSLLQCWKRYTARNPEVSPVDHFCFHLPFTRIAEKALRQLFKCKEELASRLHLLQPSLTYNKIIGNSYTASLYLSLCSLLDFCEHNLTNQRVGFFSYGSGFVAEFFSGLVQANYQQHLLSHQHLLVNRSEISYQQYLDFYHFELPQDGSSYSTEHYATGAFRLAGIKNHRRLYEVNPAT